jgi:DNA-directed RNA polymerase subunit beta'
VKRLEVVEAFKKSGNRPEWMVLDVLPVLPPDLRPMVQLDGGRFAPSDLNDLYRRVINRNNRLNKLLQLGAPEIIIRNEKRMLQEAVDALIDNGRRGRPVTGAGNRALKSLSDLLKGKQGRFRQNLLGKRVDYSGRSVIVVGPELKLHQCGLPKEMALELFKPFVMKKIVQEEYAHNIKTARRLVERAGDVVWDILEEVIKDHPVLLNRAPTLHRLGIQAFEPVLVEGRAIKLHPLVCTAYNADFDGDQMAVHLPLSAEAQAEARFLMLSANNLLKPQDGNPVTVPTQDMVMGCYYLTIDMPDDKGQGKTFSSIDEAIMAYDSGDLGLHATIKVRVQRPFEGKVRTGLVESTLGRFIANDVIPQDLGFVDRTKEENLFKLEYDKLISRATCRKIIDRCIRTKGISATAEILDRIKSLGFKYSTRGGISIGIFDMIVPDIKKQFVEEAEEKVDRINQRFQRGLLNDDGRYQAVVETLARHNRQDHRGPQVQPWSVQPGQHDVSVGRPR